MTLQRVGEGTGSLGPISGLNANYAGDLAGMANPMAPTSLQEALGPHKFEFISQSQAKGIVGWKLTIYDWRAGLNVQLADVARGHNRLAQSSAVTHFNGYAHSPLLTTVQNTITVTTPDTLFWTMFLNRLVMATTGGAGALAASKLLAETSSSDPTLIDTTYVPLGIGTVYGLWGNFFINNSTVERLAIGSSAAIDIISVLGSPPTSLGQMDAATAGATGLIQFPLPDGPFLIAAADKLLYGLGTGAIAQALTTVTSGLPIGRQAVGTLALGGRKIRAIWRYPYGFPTAALAFGSTGVRWRLVSTTPYGTAPEEIDVGLPDVTCAAPIRDGCITGDDDRLIFFDGRPQELGWKSDRKYSSTMTNVVRGIHVVDKRELIACCNEVANAATGTTNHWHERYDWDLRAWSVCSVVTTLTDGALTTGYKSARGSPTLPFARSTRMIHCCGGNGVTTARFLRKYIPPVGYNEYLLRGVKSFENTALVVTPGLLFPDPITYAPKLPTGAYYGGDPTGGGQTMPTPGSLRLDVVENGGAQGSGPHAVWDDTPSKSGRYQPWPQNQTRILFPQLRVLATQGSDPTLIPNMLPLTVEGLAFLPVRKKRSWLWWR